MQNSSTIPLAEKNFCHYSAIIIYKLFKALIQLFVKYKMLVERFFSMGIYKTFTELAMPLNGSRLFC